MPLISVRNYSDPEQFEAAYVAASVEIMPAKPVPFAACVVRLELDRLWMTDVDEAAPRVKWATQSPKRTFFRFLTTAAADFIIDGAALQPNEIIHLGQAHSYFERSSGPIHWAGMSLAVEDAAAAGAAMAGRDITTLREPARIVPAPDALARLRSLHARTAKMVDRAPHLLQSEGVAHALEQSLIAALMGCLRADRDREPAWSRRCHEMVMRRFHAILEKHPDRALYLPEICAAIRVPERTLRLCCQEHLDMSPKRYLLLRRMHLVRRALRAASPAGTTVTEVATRFGFWHFGRFAGCYRQMFGEPPSTTLSRPPH